MYRLAAVLALTVLALVGCTATPPAADSPETTVEAPTPTPTPETPEELAERLAAQLQAAVPSITTVEAMTETNDPNDLIGRPNGYVSGAFLTDSRVTCTEISVDCGATIEVWPTEADAQARADYIQGILKASPMLGSEYHYLVGAALVRVTGNLDPSLAAEYEAALAR